MENNIPNPQVTTVPPVQPVNIQPVQPMNTQTAPFNSQNQKKKLPVWAWVLIGCSGGCFLILVIYLIFAMVIVKSLSVGLDSASKAVLTIATYTGTPTVSKTPASNKTTSQSYISDRVLKGDTALTVNSVENYSEKYVTPKEGNKLIVVDVTVENTGTESYGVGNSFYFSVQDADGYTYSDTYSSKTPMLKSDSVLPGGKIRGFLTFEVPQNSDAGLKLIYQPNIFNDDVTVINLQKKN